MKKLTYLLFLAIGVTACSVESMDSTENLVVADAKVKITVAESFNVPQEICEAVPAEFSITAAVGSNLQVQQLVGDVWVQVFQASSSTANPQTFNLSFAEAGSYSLRYKIGAGGFSAPVPVTVVDCSDCEESFTYVDNGDGTYTFTYVPAEDMDAALVVFTFAQGVAVSGYEWDWNGASSSRTESMNLTACEEYTWTVKLEADCAGKSGQSNVWTDFKVNGNSKKADPEDKFTVNCN